MTRRRRSLPFRAALAAMLAAIPLVLLIALSGGCGKNSPATVLVPTGIRPAPAVPTGGLFGLVVFDTVIYPGLEVPPFPPTTAQLFRGGALVGDTTTTAGDRSFVFRRLRPGDYFITVRSHAFSPATYGPFRVVDVPREAGDLRLLANPRDSLSSLTYVIGTMPGFGASELGTFSTYCDANTVGLWTYPNVLFPALPITAGTYRLKFVTDASSTDGHLIGWGGVGSDTLTAPVHGTPVRFGTDPASDLVVRFPVTGVYAMTFDERRLTMDITPVPPGASRLRAGGAAVWPRIPRRTP